MTSYQVHIFCDSGQRLAQHDVGIGTAVLNNLKISDKFYKTAWLSSGEMLSFYMQQTEQGQ